MENLLTLEGVCFERNGRTILRNIDFSLPENHILTIVGPNGAGKSTLISLILGLNRPTSGKILKKTNLKISFVPQKFNALPDLPMTVKRFLADIQSPQQNEWLERLGIIHLLNSPLQNLSGGETQRLLLVRAVLRQPNLIILDEPASGIDPISLSHYYQTIQNYQQETGTSILLVSHDIHLVMATSNYVICLNQHICCEGKPNQIAHSSEFQKLFGSEFAIYHHHHDHEHL